MARFRELRVAPLVVEHTLPSALSICSRKRAAGDERGALVTAEEVREGAIVAMMNELCLDVREREERHR